MKPKEVSDRLALDNVAKNHTWKVEPSCATTGDGIFEGLVSNAKRMRNLEHADNLQAWLSNHIKTTAPR